MPDKSDWRSLLEQRIREARDHASYFFYKNDHPSTERSVFRSWKSAISDIKADFEICSWESCKSDPPDIIFHGAHKEVHGAEITELVDYPTEEKTENIDGQIDYWTETKLRDRIVQIIDRKSKKLFNAGPYHAKHLIIHSDEASLHARDRELRNIILPNPNQFDYIWLLLSAKPELGNRSSGEKCPLYKLKD